MASWRNTQEHDALGYSARRMEVPSHPPDSGVPTAPCVPERWACAVFLVELSEGWPARLLRPQGPCAESVAALEVAARPPHPAPRQCCHRRVHSVPSPTYSVDFISCVGLKVLGYHERPFFF